MSGEEESNAEVRLPDSEEDVLELAGAETAAEENLAVAQARRIGDLPDE